MFHFRVPCPQSWAQSRDAQTTEAPKNSMKRLTMFSFWRILLKSNTEIPLLGILKNSSAAISSSYSWSSVFFLKSKREILIKSIFFTWMKYESHCDWWLIMFGIRLILHLLFIRNANEQVSKKKISVCVTQFSFTGIMKKYSATFRRKNSLKCSSLW